MNRRTILKGGVILAATAHTAASAPAIPKQQLSIDDFLAKALPSQKAAYHANALAEAMSEIAPGRYLTRIDIKTRFAYVYAMGDDNAAI
jgi:hypothetical protein